MADMIDAKEAKQRLGCDDAALQNYVNAGTIRAQRSGGKLLLNEEDVGKLANDKDEEGTIVLTGDSDDLSIDLGKVVDDSAETIVHNKGDKQGTESITFGEDLEVVNFDDNQNTSELVFDETKQTGAAGNLSFTDSNTAVMTAVDETAVGATTAPIDFQTSVDEPKSSGSARRSVRSQRVLVEAEAVHWIWPTLMIVTLVVAFFFILPYYVMSVYPGEGKYAYSKDSVIGVGDNGWTGMAGGVAGFTVEPDKDVWEKRGNGEFFANPDPQVGWRFKQYRGSDITATGARPETFVVTAIDTEKKTATTTHGKTYPLREKTVTVGDQTITETSVDIWK